MANESLGKAKSRKNDEFYTVYDYIQKEMNAYLEYDPNVFRGKTILLPCDDPEWSNFTKYFAQNFETLGIKKLISTSYATDRKKQQYEQYHQMTLFELNFPQYDEEKPHSHGKIFTLTRDINKSGVIDIDDLEWQYLEGDGDFRSDEVCALRDEADIIVTNPPFSLFREFVAYDTGSGIKAMTDRSGIRWTCRRNTDSSWIFPIPIIWRNGWKNTAPTKNSAIGRRGRRQSLQPGKCWSRRCIQSVFRLSIRMRLQ